MAAPPGESVRKIPQRIIVFAATYQQAVRISRVSIPTPTFNWTPDTASGPAKGRKNPVWWSTLQ
jgi:hypothetical protein